jgi:thioredoxin-related protein
MAMTCLVLAAESGRCPNLPAAPASRRRQRVPFRTPVPRLLVLIVLIAGVAAPLISIMEARAAELVMFESPSCEWCEAWDRDVGVVYQKTDEGHLAPLRRVEIHGSRPEGLEGVDAVVYTPTFVLMEEGQELGRITGYPGEDHFWGLLGVLLKKLNAATGS